RAAPHPSVSGDHNPIRCVAAPRERSLIGSKAARPELPVPCYLIEKPVETPFEGLEWLTPSSYDEETTIPVSAGRRCCTDEGGRRESGRSIGGAQEMASTGVYTGVPLSEAEHRVQLRRAVVASTVGTAIEWYDFFLYSTVTGLVFAKLFFPQSDHLVGTLEAFGVYAVGFVARPVGAAIFGHYGDRIGRKSTL